MEQSMIDALKECRSPFGLLDESMKRAMLLIGKKNFEIYTLHTGMGEWCKCQESDGFLPVRTYRLKADLEYCEWVYREFEIVKNEHGRLVYYNGSNSCALISALSYKDFRGFKYANGKVTSCLRMYSQGATSFSRDIRYIGEASEVHIPTHVVFSTKK